MGCGPSQADPAGRETDQKPGIKPQENGVQNGSSKKSNDTNKRMLSADSNANRADTASSNPVPKSIAFTVDLDGQQTGNKLLGAPPPRLQRLDPLNVPKLTADQLAEKQKIADEKREQQMKKRQSASLKNSRRRRQILEAQKFEVELQQQSKQHEIQEALTSAGKSRESKLNNIKERQLMREERAKRAREKVKKLNQLDQDLDLEVEKDEDYNGDEVDSWLDGENNNNNNSSNLDINSADGERIYSGRTSPKKRFHENENGLKRGISANTVDSFDNAYNRKPPSGSTKRTIDTEADDFFDS